VARLLGIDWDQRFLRIVEANVQGGKGVLQRAWVWEEQVCPNPAQAEEAGRRLKERLKEAGVAPAPVRFVIGRDGVICRDVLYPDVPANEVPAIVNFQAGKDLSIPIDEAVIDFIPNRIPGPAGEKRALATIIHAELLRSIEKTCQAAGLKLDCVSASGVGHVSNWQAATGPSSGAETAAVLVLNSSGGELSITRDGQLLFSRVLVSPRADGGARALLPEVRRTLAAFETQFPGAPVRSLNVTGGSTTEERQELATVLGMPVTGYEVFPAAVGRDIPPTRRGLLAAAAGLVQARKPLQADFLNPKRTLPPPSRKPLYYAVGAAAAVLFLVGLFIYWSELARRQQRLEELQASKSKLQKQISDLGDVEKRLEAINTWANGEVILLDELYELAARFPDTPGLRITKVTWTPVAQPTSQPATTPGSRTPVPARPQLNPAPKPVARLVIQATGEADRLEKLRAALNSAEHWKLDLWEKDVPSAGTIQATLKVFRIPARDYDRIMETPEHTTIGMTPTRRAVPERGGVEP